MLKKIGMGILIIVILYMWFTSRNGAMLIRMFG